MSRLTVRCALADRVEERGEDAVAVDQQLDVVAHRDGGAGERLGGEQELVLADVDGLAAQLVALALLAAMAQRVRRVPQRAQDGEARRARPRC